MSDLTKIAVDAMGGDGSPKKIIDGIIHNHKSNKENFFKIFGNELEININSELKGYKELLTTFLDKENINICKYESPFIKNKLNVLQPKDPLVAKSVEVFLTPGLAFTVNGKRLGRGGGYYDRLFSKYPETLKIGLTSNERILQDIPIEDHDFFMNYVFTNDKYYKSDM